MYHDEHGNYATYRETVSSDMFLWIALPVHEAL